MKKILFIFILMVTLVPFQVFGETDESAGGYDFSYMNRRYKYSFGDGYYLSVPDEIIIDSKKFDAFSIIETDISLDNIKIDYKFDFNLDNNKNVTFVIEYKDILIYTKAYMSIKDYIKIESEINIDSYQFDIWEYIDTNINKDNIEIIGTYDLNNNGKYGLILKSNDILVNTTLVVDIEENKEVEIIETTCPVEEKKEVSSYETKNYTSNYYDYHYYTEESNDDIKEVTCNNIPTPINRIIYSEQEQNNDLFYYISYIFYFLTIVLLSINVVRKK